MLIDITPPIRFPTEVWPGDTAPSIRWLCRIEAGATVNLSTIETTVHLGAHADAPLHYDRDGLSIEAVPLDVFIGPARVIRVTREMLDGAGRVPASALAGELSGCPPRVLVATGTYAPNSPYSEEFASFSPEAIDLLASHGVRLIGIDTPSVDPLEDKALSAHHAVARHGMTILEGLDLAAVEAGDYELIALPLRLVGAEASPVRAVLRKNAGTEPGGPREGAR